MPKDERFVIGAEDAGRRLDQVLAGRPSVGSRGKARRAISSGKVAIDGAAAGPEDGGQPCPEGMVVELAWNRPGTGHARNAGRQRLRASGVVVIHEDAVLLALDKPVGMLSDAATRAQRRDEDTLAARARGWVGRGDVWPVHRIDRDTSGVVLFAKGAEARAHLKAQWEGEKPKRAYTAILQGELDDDRGAWSHPMRWNPKARRQEPCKMSAEGAALGTSRFEVTERLPGATVVRVELDTGRRNQIRLSACLAGHPLVGERQYTPDKVGVKGGAVRRLPSLARQALHASELVVRHPSTNEPLVLRAPLAADLKAWLKRCRAEASR